VPSAEIYLGDRDLDQPLMGEDDIVGLLRSMSARDCLVAIAHLSTRLFSKTRPQESEALRRALAEQLLGSLASQVLYTLASGTATTVFCEQQLVHLARLVILYATGAREMTSMTGHGSRTSGGA
jgi:hypothetical protein